MSYDARGSWGNHFSSGTFVYPAEYLIRIFKGTYPQLVFRRPDPNMTVLDVGAGEGRHIVFFKSLGLNVFAIDIHENMVRQLREKTAALDVPHDNIRVGTCASIPFEDEIFDYLVSWNSSYYMSADAKTYDTHVKEMSRVVKRGGWIIVSVPKKTSFIFSGSTECEDRRYHIIRKDPFELRNGEVFRCFETIDELKGAFDGQFYNFSCADIHDDCFGYNYHWYLLIGQKK